MSPTVAPSQPHLASFVGNPRWEAAQKVAGSASFQRSPRLRELLLYICERALLNRPQDLREQQIGCAVFGRKPDYNPGEDNIVRVEIRQLRKRLEEYYAGEGKGEPTIIVVPKGAYIPQFEERIQPAPVVVAEPLSVPKPAPDRLLDSWNHLRRQTWFWIQAGVIALLSIVSILLWQQNRVAAKLASFVAINQGPLWPLLFNEAHETFVTCADSSLVVAQSILHRPITIEEYISGNYDHGRGSETLDATSLDTLRSLARWQFTDITDVRLVQKIYHVNGLSWGKVSVRNARTAQIQDFKDGNSILLGSSRSNLWTRLFDPALNFQFDFDEGSRVAFIRNKTPLAGEPSEYWVRQDGASGVVYGLISFVPNLRHTGNVLMIAGSSAESTEATGEFILNAQSSAGILNDLMNRNHGRMPYFQILLKSSTLAGVAKNAEVVAVRTLADPHQVD